MTKAEVKKMMESIHGILTYEDENLLQYRNPGWYGDDLCFEFENDILISLFC